MSSKTTHHNVIVVGGGPAGATTASLLAKSGVDVAICEREAFPRFHIGESMLPFSRDILEEIGFWQKLVKSPKHIRKYGAEFVDFSGDDQLYIVFEKGLTSDHPFAFEVQRADFDSELLNHAKSLGVQLYQPMNVESFTEHPDHIEIATQSTRLTADYLVDASGRDCLIGRVKGSRTPFPELNHVAVFAHYEDIPRPSGRTEGDIVIGILPDQAWSWFIPFRGNRTSIGVVCRNEIFRREQKPLATYLERMLSSSNILASRINAGSRVSEVQSVGNYSFRCRELCGERWIMVGDSGAFLDPIFSSGVHIAIHSAKFAADALLKNLGSKQSLKTRSDEYEAMLLKGMNRFKFIIDLFYSCNFARDMKKVMSRAGTRKAFTSALAGDVWNDQNPLFTMNAL